jgi:5'-nucleotidase
VSRGDWMQTYTGKAFYPMAPHYEEVDPKDIAHALSMLCRYGGHVNWFYSVAEHCVRMSYAVSPENALWALLHDATEAYMGDMIRPLKRSMPAYVEAEDRLMQAICDRFGLDHEMPVEVHEADSRILHDERAALLGPSLQPWNDALEALKPLGVTVTGWIPPLAEYEYLNRFYELTGEHQ